MNKKAKFKIGDVVFFYTFFPERIIKRKIKKIYLGTKKVSYNLSIGEGRETQHYVEFGDIDENALSKSFLDTMKKFIKLIEDYDFTKSQVKKIIENIQKDNKHEIRLIKLNRLKLDE